MRVTFLIDGFNLYHSLKKASQQAGFAGGGTRWLDLQAMCRSQLHLFGKKAVMGDVYYFSAIARYRQTIDPDTIRRHQMYIQCLEASGVQVVLGRFKTKKVWCDHCQQNIKKHEEKETDVAISVTLMQVFMQGSCDCAVIITGDTDVAPAVKMAKTMFPANKVGFLFPHNRKNDELMSLSPKLSFKLSGQIYAQNQFADPFILPNKKALSKPATW